MRTHPRPVIDPRVDNGFRPADPTVEAKDVETRLLRLNIIGSPVITEDELAERKALRARFLAPQEFPLELYRTRLRDQRGGSRVPAIRTIPVVLAPGESATDDEAVCLTVEPEGSGRACEATSSI
ncbi:uncharacterized protein PHALS_12535 [Plasmopara halstedii]|uniref:Uncharacterized protein n=1 Tax=Plasmopara halstedii TaxID=4781 RepID=A0A0P1ALR2_PLAHL|nr:uncharacterized protein PHALS_12535 [Plasmopara halstedii]CEG42242.1 hypothetical protein PHALS_12535 [Plasmopara halstedii]|eukprot:XP_024578611.1 hypothetical protein PHALS_12535 [Plasmopara halstedii]